MRTPVTPSSLNVGTSGACGVRVSLASARSRTWPDFTAAAIVAPLGRELAKAVRDPDTLRRFEAMGIDPVGNTPGQYAASLKEDIAYYANAVKLSGAKID